MWGESDSGSKGMARDLAWLCEVPFWRKGLKPQDPCTPVPVPHSIIATVQHPPPAFLTLDAQWHVCTPSKLSLLLPPYSKARLPDSFGATFPVRTHSTQNHTEEGLPGRARLGCDVRLFSGSLLFL